MYPVEEDVQGVGVDALGDGVQEVYVVLCDLVVEGDEFDVLQADQARVRQQVGHVLGLVQVRQQVAEEGYDGNDDILGAGLAEDLQQLVQGLNFEEVPA